MPTLQRRAQQNGIGISSIESDPAVFELELLGVRGSPRFKRAVAVSAAAHCPCGAPEKFRELLYRKGSFPDKRQLATETSSLSHFVP
jgi:hypothetical protein